MKAQLKNFKALVQSKMQFSNLHVHGIQYRHQAWREVWPDVMFAEGESAHKDFTRINVHKKAQFIKWFQPLKI
jgi:hypothetical protein